ncbi:MAG: hybrid sensor histidine kinase/response regulator [Polyangiaceae bacterium]
MAAGDRDWEGSLWRALVEASPDIVLVVDVDGTIVFSNRTPVFLAGATAVGRKIWEFAVGDAQARLQDKIREVVAGKKAVVYDHPGHRDDGTAGWYHVRAVPVLVGGEVEHILWSSQDITERMNALERLEFQARVLDAVSQPVIASTVEGVITYWNEAAERTFGYSPAEALGQKGNELLRGRYAEGAYDELVKSVRSPSSAWQGEVTLHAKSGEAITIEASIRVLRDETGKGLLGITVMQDATMRRRLEEQLRQSQKMEAIGLLAGGVAHDFNNLLAVILGFSELAARKLPSGHPVTAQLSEVFDAARRGAELTRKLLAFSRKQIIQPRPVEVGTAVDYFTRMIRRIVGEDVELSVERPAGELVIRADPVQLEQVLLNLCTNARQAMPEGGKLLLRSLAVDLDAAFVARHPWAREGAFAEVTVTDTGVGMDDATRLRVFEPFFTTRREGTGLGLATVYGIVQQHGGFVHLESAQGEGTTVRVYFPQSTDMAAPRSAGTNGVHVPRGTGGNEVVLVAEDEPSLRALVAMTLTELGYRVITARDGEEAVQRFEEHAKEIALVLLDVVMPGIDARQAYERLQAVRPDVKVLFTTGYAPASTRLAQLLQSGKVPVIEKPFTPQALAAKVRSTLDAG